MATSLRLDARGVAAQTIAAGVAGGGALCSLLALFTPWLASGATSRSGFALATVLDEAGYVHGAPSEALLVAVRLLPVLAALALAALALRRRAAAAVFAFLAGAVVLIGAAVVLTTLGSGIEAGPFLAIAAGTLSLGGALVLATLLATTKGTTQ